MTITKLVDEWRQEPESLRNVPLAAYGLGYLLAFKHLQVFLFEEAQTFRLSIENLPKGETDANAQ